MVPLLLQRSLALLLLVGGGSATSAAPAFLAATPPAHHHGSRVVMRASSQPQQEPAQPPQRGLGLQSRSQVLQRQAASVLAGAALLFLGASPLVSGAAVPSIQEYYGAEGASPRTNNYIISGKANRKAQQQAAEGAGTQGAGKQQQAPPSDPRALLGEMDKALGSLTPMIKEERWDDVLAATKKQPLSALLTPYLGYGSASALAQAAGKTAAQAKALEEARTETGLTLQQLVDYAFSNRVVFFNALDKQQVAALAAQRAAPPDLSEPLGLLSDTTALVKGLSDQF